MDVTGMLARYAIRIFFTNNFAMIAEYIYIIYFFWYILRILVKWILAMHSAIQYCYS